MDNRILDDLENVDNRVYYQKSKKNLVIASAFLIMAITSMVISVRFGFDSELIAIVGGIFIIITIILSGIGLVNGVKSFTKKEDHSSGRILVFLGNFLIFGLFMWSMVMNIVDLIRFFN